MYVVKVWRRDHWESWGSAQHPRIVNMYLDLLRVSSPQTAVKVVVTDG